MTTATESRQSQPNVGLFDYPEHQRFPDGDVCFSINDRSYRPSWTTSIFRHKNDGTNMTALSKCVGVFQCPIPNCVFIKKVRVPRKRKGQDGGPPTPVGGDTCKKHDQLLVHRSCNAQTKMVYPCDQLMVNGPLHFEHSGTHNHPHPPEKLSKKAEKEI